jgi:hypothetical protein
MATDADDDANADADAKAATQPPSTSTSSKWCDEMESEDVEGALALAEEVKEKDDVWPKRRRYGEAVEAENIYKAIASIEVPPGGGRTSQRGP